MIPQPATPKSSPAYAALIEQRREELRGQLRPALVAGMPLVWEVGCGHGHFLTAYAAAHPDHVCIGIDVESDRIERASRKRDRARLPNLHFIRAEARLFLSTLPPATRFSAVYILFPDPWPKLRHRKHRVLQSDFLAEVAAHAAPDCRLYFRTDYQPYFAEAAAVLANSPHWERVPAAWPFEYETVFQRRAKAHESFVARRRAPP